MKKFMLNKNKFFFVYKHLFFFLNNIHNKVNIFFFVVFYFIILIFNLNLVKIFIKFFHNVNNFYLKKFFVF
jgi:hypothetical protein